MSEIAALVTGSIAGGLTRHYLSGFIYRLVGTTFPYGTLLVNILGCFVVGFLAGISEQKFSLSPQMRLLLIVGFCGALTTFSTLILETTQLVKYEELAKAMLNIVISIVLGLLFFKIGAYLSSRVL